MRLLIVEDDRDIAHLVELLLDEHTLRMVAEPSLVTAEDMLDAEAALVDHMLPNETGCSLLERISVVNPACRRILWTAAPPHEACLFAHRTLIKPNSIEEINEALRGR